MKTRFLLPTVAGLSLAAAACSMQPRVSETAAPQPYKFPHSTHVEAEVACLECHSPILKASSLRRNEIDVALPKKAEICSNCHDPIPDYKPVQRFEPAVNFNHVEHLPRVANKCTRCHVKFTEPGDIAKPVPAMGGTATGGSPEATCTACHNHAQDFGVGRCQPCHVDLKRYTYKPVAEYTHEANFLQTHGRWARASVETCASCHDQTMCATCHTATTRPLRPSIQFPEKIANDFIHRGDFISRHAAEQKADPASCNRCHGQAYCQSCHAFQGISAPMGTGGRNPHPAGFLSTHGALARSNINACAACHSQNQGSTCLYCHSHGGVNPHPPGFKGTAQQKSSNSMCLVCHAGG